MSKFFALLVLISCFIFGSSFVSMLLWNSCLVPAITVVNPVGFWQMLGLFILFSGPFGLNLALNNKK
jgi:hypothetical protein